MMPWIARRQALSIDRVGDQRSPYQRDKARILHSAAFRRLQAKTQIMRIGENDFYRTRLTHSLEAAQIGSALVTQLRNKYSGHEIASLLPDDALIEALCLAHDLGHPPFGHGGETALNRAMAGFGGFEGNGQTFRIVGKLEPYTAEGGMDLTRRTLLGLLKYPAVQPLEPYEQPIKAIYALDADLLDWVLSPFSEADRLYFQQLDPSLAYPKSLHKSLDASIMELADDIAYAVHDLEDAIATGICSQQHWYQALASVQVDADVIQFLQQTASLLFDNQHFQRKSAIGTLVNRLVSAIEIDHLGEHIEQPLLRFNGKLPRFEQQLLQFLKQFIWTYVIKKPEIQQQEYRGQRIVQALFHAFHSEPLRLLPLNTQARFQLLAEQGHGARAVCDYVAGMTDEYANTMAQRLFGTFV